MGENLEEKTSGLLECALSLAIVELQLDTA